MSETPTQEEIDRQQERLAAERARLADLLLQEAKLGSAHAPPGVSGGIREARAAIQRIKAWLRAQGITIADAPDDTAPSIVYGGPSVAAPVAALPLDTI